MLHLSLLAIALAIVHSAFAQYDPALVGTWTTKSRAVLTGPGFYDPVNEKFFEPSLTGISYSFTADGFWESAYYRAVANPIDPACPKGVLQFQHGKYLRFPNGSLSLQPFADDGRQLVSDPCKYKVGIYTRYNQSETIKWYEVKTDEYHKTLRLNLYGFDGTPLNAMYIAYQPPQMLPTITMNPMAAPTHTGKAKRDVEEAVIPFNHKLMKRSETVHSDKLWWLGAFMTGVGAVGYFCF